jgi:hypothetical protein
MSKSNSVTGCSSIILLLEEVVVNGLKVGLGIDQAAPGAFGLACFRPDMFIKMIGLYFEKKSVCINMSGSDF